jgi:hypothetical protein
MEGLTMNTKPAAFPWTHGDIICTGMTLRDYFAAKAMHAIVSDPETQMNYEEIATRAYQYADAMIEVREA